MPRMFVTYTWDDKEEGDFFYLVQELESVGIEAQYDKIALVPGKRIWEQIANEIVDGDYEGWAMLVTPNSINSEPCKEELAYALDRALTVKGGDFPLIGLLHEVSIEDVPKALKVRLCVSLKSPNWKEEIKAGLEDRPPVEEAPVQTTHYWQVHEDYNGQGVYVVEARPRFGEIPYWCFVVPKGTEISGWGFGPSGGGVISPASNFVQDGGEFSIEGEAFNFFGSGDRLSPGVSAFVGFTELPEFIEFGHASGQFGAPGERERITF